MLRCSKMLTESDVDTSSETVILNSRYTYEKEPFGVTFDLYVHSFQANVAYTKVKLVLQYLKIIPEIMKFLLVFHQM